MHSSILLDNLKIKQWIPRKLQHPWYQQREFILAVEPAIFAVKCMVLLPIKNLLQPYLGSAAEKILTGMLGVLQLEKHELSIINIYTANNYQMTTKDWQQVAAEINRWHPRSILQLDMTVPMVMTTITGMRTYHPEHLLRNQQDKIIAYKTLLSLKDKLHAEDSFSYP